MIKVSVMYPNSEGVKFDTEYYKNTHLPMVQKLVGSALKDLELDLGIGGRAPGEATPYVAIAHLKFDDVASFQAAFGLHAVTFADDVKNYSNVQGKIQISDLVSF
ncbi:uncharacterized protein (TIGR02118 family) [Maribacter caenipelagi]|uniref:Uncharacterized protein (TIGR02118 family) n=1 Tax=Maribacter caenipelagi TaxID=1447781 RepID=A0A4R7D6D1_9FLAO|nr:EthD family reductase [Maribacter caenipelagi]TDS16703.1 uncharacterized protein (TIGR02118 family) [Maribacter caenipelagi]